MGNLKGKPLFNKDIHYWPSWGKVFQSIEAFQPIVKHIFAIHGLEFTDMENCNPGTNAVFKIGRFIVKVFAPIESGMDTDSDFNTELFGIERAGKLGIPVPKLIASGTIKDKYEFRYLIMEHIYGITLGDIEGKVTDCEKKSYAKQLRDITDKMNTPSCRFNDVDVIERALHCKRWNSFPEGFQFERRNYLDQYRLKNIVYVHGDLNPGNVLVDEGKKLYIIDFADAILAPPEYEIAAVVCELFCFEKPYMDGYFGEYDAEELSEKCLRGLLMHDFGYNIIRDNLGCIDEIVSLETLKQRLYSEIKSNGKGAVV